MCFSERENGRMYFQITFRKQLDRSHLRKNSEILRHNFYRYSTINHRKRNTNGKQSSVEYIWVFVENFVSLRLYSTGLLEKNRTISKSTKIVIALVCPFPGFSSRFLPDHSGGSRELQRKIQKKWLPHYNIKAGFGNRKSLLKFMIGARFPVEKFILQTQIKESKL